MVDILLQVESVAAFVAVALGVEGVVGGEGDDVDESSAEAFDGTARSVVVGVAGEPECFLVVGTGEREQELAGTEGVMVTAGRGEAVIADVTEVVIEVGGMAQSQGDGTGD